MVWPVFDPGEAVNQTISAAATIFGVLGGGLLAFRLGIRQLRHERAIDRRLDWQERGLIALEEYKSVLGVLIRQYESAQSEEGKDLRNYTLGEATRLGRQVQSFLRTSELYGTADERISSTRVFRTQLDLYIATWSYSANPSTEGHRLPEMKRLVDDLERARAELVSRFRSELGLE
jgi:hypothetical protein